MGSAVHFLRLFSLLLQEEVSLYAADLRELPLDSSLATACSSSSTSPSSPSPNSVGLGTPNGASASAGAGGGGGGGQGDDEPVLLHLLPYKVLWEEYWKRAGGCGAVAAAQRRRCADAGCAACARDMATAAAAAAAAAVAAAAAAANTASAAAAPASASAALLAASTSSGPQSHAVADLTESPDHEAHSVSSPTAAAAASSTAIATTPATASTSAPTASAPTTPGGLLGEEPDWLPLYWHLAMSDAAHTHGMAAPPPDGCPPVPFIHDADTPLSVSLDVFAAWMGLRQGQAPGAPPGAGGSEGPGAAGPGQGQALGERGAGACSRQASADVTVVAIPVGAAEGDDALAVAGAGAAPGDGKGDTPGAGVTAVAAVAARASAPVPVPLPADKASGSGDSTSPQQPAPGCGGGSWCRHMEWLRGGGSRMLRLLGGSGSTSGSGSTAASSSAAAPASGAGSTPSSLGSDPGSGVGVHGIAGSCSLAGGSPGDSDSSLGLAAAGGGGGSGDRAGDNANATTAPLGSALAGVQPQALPLHQRAVAGKAEEEVPGAVAALVAAAESAAAGPLAEPQGQALHLLWLNRVVSAAASPAELGMCDQSVVALLNLCGGGSSSSSGSATGSSGSGSGSHGAAACAACLMARGALYGDVGLVEAALAAGGLPPLDEQQVPAPHARRTMTPPATSTAGAAGAGAGAPHGLQEQGRRSSSDGREGRCSGCGAGGCGEVLRPPMLMPLGIAAANGHAAVLQVRHHGSYGAAPWGSACEVGFVRGGRE